ncbi:MAG: Nicotinate phosphoribosyltransferase [uncultured Phycisphaerae bacterium]|uniref:Nicotinate phosphoribosyltransferase n=1 Tax=uncultured Phycisphaerae bacterium TaxID=904963 RepID=A0A6J4PGK9_9BACT|nr:MAG: Nicotinate phosphoribosyltransferase [uncultured Phycisphaerae bacterium]
MTSPLVTSLIDNDLYKFTMGQVTHDFAEAVVRYRFINRDRRPFPPGFADELRAHVDAMADLRLTPQEYDWVRRCAPWFKLGYLQWLRGFRFDPTQVRIGQQGDDLRLEVEGPWIETIYWEVPLMAMISELYFKSAPPDADWEQRLKEKADRLANAGVSWIDFGTRRRFSRAVQDRVNEVCKPYGPRFRGTSNPYFAMRHGLTPQGTFAHELPMALQAKVGVRACNRAALDAWVNQYRGDLGIALTDTVTTDVFLRDFDAYYAKLFDGVRIDSGDPAEVGERFVAHYQRLRIDPASKILVFSDALNTDRAIALHKQFEHRVKMTAGIGTHLTNDFGHRALNMVIKLTHADFGHGFVGVVKLSDEPGKHTGDPADIAAAKRSLGLGE